MKNPSTGVARARQTDDRLDCVSELGEDWRIARAAHADLLLMGMPRVNVLLMGMDGVIQNILETLRPELHEPIATWCPGEQLVLPSEAPAGTVILHEVGALAHDDQLHLLEWLEQAAGRAQVVSTTSAPLLPRVEAGAFNDILYYRLNMVCLDVSS
jgi:Sigma-54 interaction domain